MNKKIYNIQFICFFLGLTLFFPPAAPAWWGWQHQVIAEIADLQLEPSARREVVFLLGEETSMADAANWPDEVRGDRWWTASWHYINWPLELDQPDFDVFASPRENVVSAIEEQLKIFRDLGLKKTKRQEALKFVIHFVGDIHQPLHAGQGEDRGGNNVAVRFRGELTNLHAAWDGQIYEDGGDSPLEHAQKLLKGLKPEDRERIIRVRPYDWGLESHRIDREFVYPRLEDPAILDEEGGNPPELAGLYAGEAQSIIARRLLEAGLRLAYLLNATENDGPPPPQSIATKSFESPRDR